MEQTKSQSFPIQRIILDHEENSSARVFKTS